MHSSPTLPRLSTLLLVLLAGGLAAPALHAQHRPAPGPPGARPAPQFSLEASAGAAAFGRFLEQTVAGVGERELATGAGFNANLGLGLQLLPQTQFRIDGGYTAAAFEWRDDTGTDASTLDADGLGDLHLVTLSFGARRFLGPAPAPIRPFLQAGPTVAFWVLDNGGDGPSRLTNADGETGSTVVRLGLESRAGFQAALTPRVALVVEVSTTTLGNPFDGQDALLVEPEAGVSTRDEPDWAASARVRAGLSYTFR